MTKVFIELKWVAMDSAPQDFFNQLGAGARANDNDLSCEFDFHDWEKHSPTDILTLFTAGIEHPDEDVRSAVALHLSVVFERCFPEYEERVRELVQQFSTSPDTGVRQCTLLSLCSALHEPELREFVKPWIRGLLNDEDPQLREDTAWSYGDLIGADADFACELIRERLADPNPLVRLRLLHGLKDAPRNHGPSLELVMEMQRDPHSVIRLAADHVLEGEGHIVDRILRTTILK